MGFNGFKILSKNAGKSIDLILKEKFL